MILQGERLMYTFEKNNKMKPFFLLWLGQSISAFGSSMVSFSITIWLYKKTGSALILSTSIFFVMLPKMLGNTFGGPFVDRLNKKNIMILADLGAGLCTFILFLLLHNNNLEIWHIYGLNFISSFLGCLQTLASSVSLSILVPKEYYVKINGLESFSGGIIGMFSPVVAAFLFGVIDITGIILIDFITLGFAIMVLVLFVKIPHTVIQNDMTFKKYLKETMEGFYITRKEKLLWILLLFFSYINFVSGITYYNLISPMILAKSGNNAQILSFVNGSIGLGAIIGGLLTTILPVSERKLKIIFLCTIFSFLFGDILMGIGTNTIIWIIAGFSASVFIPAIEANSSYFWRTMIPVESQGRVFAFRNTINSGSICIGLISGGVLADYVFEPLINSNAHIFSRVIENTKGYGMGLMFLITGISGTIIGIFGYFSKKFTILAEKK
jgi:MFS family permease